MPTRRNWAKHPCHGYSISSQQTRGTVEDVFAVNNPGFGAVTARGSVMNRRLGALHLLLLPTLALVRELVASHALANGGADKSPSEPDGFGTPGHRPDVAAEVERHRRQRDAPDHEAVQVGIPLTIEGNSYR